MSGTQTPKEDAPASKPQPPPTTLETILAAFTPSTGQIVRDLDDGTGMGQTVPDRSVSICGHVILSFIWIAAVLAYFIWATVRFATRPEQESFAMPMAAEYPHVPVRVVVTCSNPPYCGDITILQNYTQIAGCSNLPFIDQVIPAASSASTTIDVDLCYVEDFSIPVDITTAYRVPGVTIEFSGINPGTDKSTTPHTPDASLAAYGTVRVQSHMSGHNSGGADGAARAASLLLPGETMNKVVTMDTWQVKSLLVGQTVTKVEKETKDHSIYAKAIQYEGKRPNWRGSCLLRLDPFVNLYEKAKRGTYLEVLGNVGGATSIISLFLAILAPIVGWVLPNKD